MKDNKNYINDPYSVHAISRLYDEATNMAEFSYIIKESPALIIGMQIDHDQIIKEKVKKEFGGQELNRIDVWRKEDLEKVHKAQCTAFRLILKNDVFNIKEENSLF